jgi:hypothetical protein
VNAAPPANLLRRFEVVQNAYVVPDIDAACRRYHELFGIGPFFKRERVEIAHAKFFGAPIDDPLIFSAAFAQSGSLNIEIIQPLSAGPNVFDHVIPAGSSGFHHVAIFAHQYEADRDAFVAAGCPLIWEMNPMADFAIGFVDARELLGHIIEIYTDIPFMRAQYEAIRAGSSGWDGTELIRSTDRLSS